MDARSPLTLLGVLLASMLVTGTALAGALPTQSLLAYVANGGSGTISVVELADHTQVGLIHVDGLPRAVAASPDGSLIYVATQFPDVVAVVDAATGGVIATIDQIGTAPEDVAITPDGTRLYVPSFDQGQVFVIQADRAAVTGGNPVLASIPVGAFPNAVAISPDGSLAYVAHLRPPVGQPLAADSVTVITTATNQVVTTVPLPASSDKPIGVSVSETGPFAYAVGFLFGQLSAIDTDNNQIAATTSLADVFRFPSLPTAIASAPQGLTYVVNFGSNSLMGIATIKLGAATSLVVTNSIQQVGLFPSAVAVTPAGDRIYVASFNSDAAFTGPDQVIPIANGFVAAFDSMFGFINGFAVERLPVDIAIAPRPTRSLPFAPVAQGATGQGATSAPTPTPNCYTVDCINPEDCLVAIGNHQAHAGGVRSGEGDQQCGGAGEKPTSTPSRTPTPIPSDTPTRTATRTHTRTATTTATRTRTQSATPTVTLTHTTTPTVTRTHTPVSPTPTARAVACLDCPPGVTSDSVATGIHLIFCPGDGAGGDALCEELLGQCPSLDRDGRAGIAVAEFVRGILDVLAVCPAGNGP